MDLAQNSTGLYYYELLDSEEQFLYAQILYILTYMEDMAISSTDEEAIDKIFNYVENDHPEIFYVEGISNLLYKIGDTIKKISFSGKYSMTPEEVDSYEPSIDNYVSTYEAALYSDLGAEPSDYDVIKFTYEYIIGNTEYVENSPNNQNIISVMVNGKSVCQGYAKTLQYLLNLEGIECTLVTGVARGAGHAWNLVKADGKYYYVDATWGDASYNVKDEDISMINSVPPINYDFLLITYDELSKTHTLDDASIMPVCDSMDDNYYIREGVYFTDVNEEQLKNAFDSAYESENEYITLKMDNEDTYQAMWEYLLEQQEVFKYLQDMTSVSYAENVEKQYMVFWI